MNTQFLSITLSTETDYVELITVACTRGDWNDMQACDEITGPVCVILEMLDDAERGEEECGDDPVTLSLDTAAIILPDLVANLLRRHLGVEQ